MPLTLALDTSAEKCAVAILRDGICLDSRHRKMARGHAEALVPMVQAAAAAAAVSLLDVDLVGVAKGPGSFTGLRTGIAAARGFAISSGAPAVGVSSLHAVALGAARSTRSAAEILCVLETRRTDYFAQKFDAGGNPAGPPGVYDAAGIQALLREDAILLAGNAAPRLLAELSADNVDITRAPGDGCPDPVDVAALAEAAFDKEGLAPDTLSPLYLRAPEAKLPANGGRLKK